MPRAKEATGDDPAAERDAARLPRRPLARPPAGAPARGGENPSMPRRTALPWSLVLLLLPACGEKAEARELRDALGRTAGAAKRLVDSTLAELQTKAQPMLDEAQRQLASLQRRLESSGPEAAAALRSAAAQAEQELARAKQALAAVQDSSAAAAEQAWATFRDALARASQALQQGQAAGGK